jgi:hypothetical protein
MTLFLPEAKARKPPVAGAKNLSPPIAAKECGALNEALPSKKFSLPTRLSACHE